MRNRKLILMRLGVLVCAFSLLAQQPEIIALEPSETLKLQALSTEANKAWRSYEIAEKRACDYEKLVKASRKLKETSGGCGGSITWTSEATSINSGGTFSSTPVSRWSFDKDYKYLVHTERGAL